MKSLEAQLQKMGLKVPADKIDGTSFNANPSGCISDSLVSVGVSKIVTTYCRVWHGNRTVLHSNSSSMPLIQAAGHGGTGSFISETGLIVTNWHVAHEAVRLASIVAGVDFLEARSLPPSACSYYIVSLATLHFLFSF